MATDDKAPAQCFKLCSSEGVPCTCTPTTGWNYILPEPATSQLKEMYPELQKPAPVKPIKAGETLDDREEYIESLHAAIAELQAECDDLKAQLAAMTADLAFHKANNHVIHQDLMETLEREAELQAQVERLEAITDRYDAELSESGDRNVSHMIEIKKLQAQLAAMTSERDEWQSSYYRMKDSREYTREREAALVEALTYIGGHESHFPPFHEIFESARVALEANAKARGTK